MDGNSKTSKVIEAPVKRKRGKVGNPGMKAENALSGTDEEKRAIVRQTMRNCLTFYQMDRVGTATELQERLQEFFNTCADTGQYPTVEKMCLAIGYSRQTVNDWENRVHCGLVEDSNSPVSDIIKKAKEFLATFDAELVISGNMNFLAYCFRAKNYYGMQDKQELTIEPKQAFGEQKSMEEIAASVPELLDSDIIDE